jgi:hypothetical protein
LIANRRIRVSRVQGKFATNGKSRVSNYELKTVRIIVLYEVALNHDLIKFKAAVHLIRQSIFLQLLWDGQDARLCIKFRCVAAKYNSYIFDSCII